MRGRASGMKSAGGRLFGSRSRPSACLTPISQTAAVESNSLLPLSSSRVLALMESNIAALVAGRLESQRSQSAADEAPRCQI
ncbi:hypothetical protein CKO31_22685 [Thiohalocapsa halophila]|uniref:Uncharacterized protein n=1 Tax=Thiohalocapsa halophila TaxID=69359 RepID=A0ABS1CNK7_9GAMM|nr:hypothetical protein [Thiohalocapsa halophila]